MHSLRNVSMNITNMNANTGSYSITTQRNHSFKNHALIVYNNAVLPLLTYMIYFQKWQRVTPLILRKK